MRGDDSRDLRRRVQALGLRTRGARLPAELRAAIIGYARERRRCGDGVSEIAQSVGVSAESIRRWTTMPQRAPVRALVPIVVRNDDAVSTVALIAPGGYRVEGLTVASAAELLRRLA
jgi:transposase